MPVRAGTPRSFASGISPDGRIVVGYASVEGEDPYLHQALIWREGAVEAVDIPGVDQALLHVNSRGIAIGVSLVDDQVTKFVYQDGRLTRVTGDPAGINEAGEMAGVLNTGQPVYWPSPTAEPVLLPVPDGADGVVALGINDDGVIIGIRSDYDSGHRVETPLLWRASHASVEELPMPTNADSAAALAIAGDWVSGSAFFPEPGMWQEVRWNIKTGAVDVFSDDELAGVGGINSRGHLAGFNGEYHGTLITDDVSVDLPDLAPSANPVNDIISIPSSITDDGLTVVGGSLDSDLNRQAVIWRCR
ncbi:hypothetical protein ACFQO7_37130 [Catellatospora aurea]|uniref:HAF family extracellular repeat protein n=1 Tax=Catellatospora aurea TaxID=1337874 RepID=A0ABW2H753_9ACTN